MIYAICNADDFGLSSAVNQAVTRAHTEGILTSASLLANGERFEEAVAMAKAHPTLGVGVHLNLLHGRPLLRPTEVRSLVGADGSFLGRAETVAWRVVSRSLRRDEVVREWQAQIDRVRVAGLTPTHCDSEKHLHLCFPLLTDAVAELAARNRIPVVRAVAESLRSLPIAERLCTQSWKCRYLNYRSRRARARFQADGLRSPEHYAGIGATGRMTGLRLRRILCELQPGVTEILFHPSTDTHDPMAAHSFLQAARRQDFEALCAPGLKALCAEREIQLIHYGVSL